MQRLIRLGLLAACSIACGTTATAQYRNPDFRSDRDYRSYRSYRTDRGYRSDRDNRARRDYRSERERRIARYVFAKRAYIPRLAAQLSRQANTVCWEAYRNYHHNRDYKQTYREMYQIRAAAQHVEQLVKENYYRSRHDDDHIESDLARIDSWIHHVQHDIRSWRPDHPGAHRTETLHEEMDELEEILHNLMVDYGLKSRFEQRSVRRDTYRSRYNR